MSLTEAEKSQYFSELAKKRKHPYLPFKDKEYAKRMSAKAKEARRAKQPSTDSDQGPNSQNSPQTSQEPQETS